MRDDQGEMVVIKRKEQTGKGELTWRRGWMALGLVLFAVMSACSSWRTPAPVCLAGARLDSSGRCQAQHAPRHHLPFRAGTKVRVTQGFHGYTSHREDLAYSVDMACEEGTPVVASKAGVVWAVEKESNQGCAERECVDQANYVVLDHGDGTFSQYFHLRHKGVVVEPGEQVCRGQVIGICGNTGFSSGPHLHFAVLNTQRATIPVTFVEGPKETGGLLLPRQSYISENRRESACGEVGYSPLGRDGFAHQGISLRREVPAVVKVGDSSSMVFEGRYGGDQPFVALHRRRVGTKEWTEECVEVSEDGRFGFIADWPLGRFSQGYYFLMLTGADEACRAAGWAWSYRIWVR